MKGFETIYVDLFTQEEITNILDKYKQRTLVKFDIKKIFESNTKSKNVTLMYIVKNVKGFVLDIIDTFNEANMDNKGIYKISQMTISLYEGENDLDLINKYLNIFKKLNPPTINRTVEKLLESLNQNEVDMINNDYDLTYLNYLDKSKIKKSDFINLNNLKSIPNSKGIYFINKCKPPLNISKTYTYKTQRFSIKYNKEVNNFQNLEHYLKFLAAKKYINEIFDIPRIIQNEEKRLKELKDLLEV